MITKLDYKQTLEDCIIWIRKFFEENGKDCNAVIGISGGKDSSVVAALCVEALGKNKVIGVLMPNGEQSDIEYSRLLVNHLGITNYTINIKDSVDGVIKELNKAGIIPTPQTLTNLPARIRMSTLYAVSQSNNGRVANTCNLSEDYIGYATRYGDSAGDFSPISNLTVQEVKELGHLLKLPKELVDKVPSDGLCGLTDEDKIGFTYEVLDKYIRTGVCDNINTKNKIDHLYKTNLFKMQLIPSFKPKL